MCRDRNNQHLKIGDLVTVPVGSGYFNPCVRFTVVKIEGDLVTIQAHSFRGGQALDALHRGFYGGKLYCHPGRWFVSC